MRFTIYPLATFIKKHAPAAYRIPGAQQGQGQRAFHYH